MQSNHLSVLKGQSQHLLFGVILWIFSIYYLGFFVVLIGYLVWVYRIDKSILVFTLIAILSYSGFRSLATIEPLNLDISEGMLLYKDRDNRALMKNGNQKFYLYYDDLSPFASGDKVYFKGEVRSEHKVMNIGDFDYQKYLMSGRIHGVVYAEKMVLYDQGFSIYQFREYVHHYIDDVFNDSKPYIKTFVLAERYEIDASINQAASALGIAHLFAISGLHIALLAVAFDTLLKKLGFSNQLAFVVLSVFFLSYMVLTAFSPSVMRAGSVLLLLKLNRLYNWSFTGFDLTCLLCLGFLFFRPYYYVRAGFLLTFSVSMGLILMQEWLRKGGKITQLFKVSILAFSFSLPIVTGFYYSFNPFTVFLNVFFVAYTTFLLLPMTYLTFLVNFIEPLLVIITNGFETLVGITYNLFNLSIRLYFDHPIKILVYYVLLGLSLANLAHQKFLYYFSGLLLFVLFIYLTPYLNVKQKVFFFHVDGDSTLIVDRFNRCNILIDTGNEDAFESLKHHLHRLHITHLDYVFISHKHSDHYGAYASVNNAFNITTTITNVNQVDYENHWFFCGDIAIYIYPLEFPHRSENNRSMVKMVVIGGERYLFTGDIEREREHTLLKYHLEADVLKVGHHGSQTSSNDFFLNYVNPSDSVILTHQNNRFGHPSKSALKRLGNENIKIHRTDTEGMIVFEYVFNKRTKITPYSP